MKIFVNSKILIKSFWQSSAIVFISIVIAFAVNSIRKEGLPVIAKNNNSFISFSDAQKFFFEQKAIFIDARSNEDYQNNHIKGAKSLPWEEVDKYFLKATEGIKSDELIITYCDGATCNLSKELSAFLINMGFKNVKVLINGWSIWKQNNLPVE
ncbi:MAG: rhodanese-like domain-containing protein [Desulfobacterales bacterium]|nr:rhodanese-like domain-containing protein [Desulfobacterales bacterium]MBF0398588.1 rhodanese-like domain-containing protein [Desulfobacterales bacterium]